MKHLILMSSVALMGGIAQAQQTTVEGKFKFAGPDSVTVSFYHNLVDFARFEKSFPVTADGHFTMQFPLGKPVVASFIAGSEDLEIFLEPGERLQMTLSQNEDVGLKVKYEGSTEDENELLTQLDLHYQQDEDFNSRRKNLAENENAFVKTLNKKYKEQRQLANDYFNNSGFSAWFRNWMQAELTYGEALQKLQYPEWRGAVTRLSDPYALSNKYFDFLKEVELHNNAALDNVTYLGFLQAYVAHKNRLTGAKGEQADFYYNQYQLAKNLLQGEQQNVVCGRLVHQSIKEGNLASTDLMLKDYRQSPAAKPYLAQMQHSYKQHLAGSRGSQAFELALEQPGGKQVSLAEYKGEPVYLYFYTTAQGSARNEVPHAQELAKNFASKPVKFVYVCLDADNKNWDSQFGLWQWPGANTRLTADAATVMQNYGLKSLPAAYVLDADGKILDSEAPRPAQVKQLTEKLSKLIAVN
jgi:thiol-disulfide isomerase/thioredoxin